MPLYTAIIEPLSSRPQGTSSLNLGAKLGIWMEDVLKMLRITERVSKTSVDTHDPSKLPNTKQVVDMHDFLKPTTQIPKPYTAKPLNPSTPKAINTYPLSP